MKKQIVVATLAGAIVLGSGELVLKSYSDQAESVVEPM